MRTKKASGKREVGERKGRDERIEGDRKARRGEKREKREQKGGRREHIVCLPLPNPSQALKGSRSAENQASAARLWVIIDVFVGQKGKGGVEDERSQEGDGKVFRVTGYIYQKLLKKCLRAAKLLLWK